MSCDDRSGHNCENNSRVVCFTLVVNPLGNAKYTDYKFSLLQTNFSEKQGGIIVNSLKVSSKSNPNSVAGALVGAIRENGKAEMQAVGAGALNQAVKAVAIARGFVAPSGVDLICTPSFTDIVIAGEERTAMILLVEKRVR